MRKNGYTLLELLVAVLLIGLVVMIAMASWTKAQSKARDGRRKADLAIVKLALEAYFNDHNEYPEGLNFSVKGEKFWDATTEEVYFKALPNDPLYPIRRYCYTADGDWMGYTLGADFENEAMECNSVPVISPTPSPTIAVTPAPTAGPTLIPVPTPTATPSGCVPCSGLGVSYCCVSQVYSESACSAVPRGTLPFSCSQPCANVWRAIDLSGNCASGMTSPGTIEGESCFQCGVVTGLNECTYYDPNCHGGGFSENRHYGVCVCW